MNWAALLLADPSPCLRHLALRDLLGRPEDDPEVRELASMRNDDPLVAGLIKLQGKDGAWRATGADEIGGKPRATMLALTRLGYLGFGPDDEAVQRGAEWLLARQRDDGAWEDTGGYSEEDETGYKMMPVRTALPLRALAACGFAMDPRAERAYDWLLDQRLPDGAWPTGVAVGGVYGYVAGYRRMPHSQWGCRSNTTASLICLALHPERCRGEPARRALDMLLARETRDRSALGYEVARTVGAEPARGTITFYARFDLASVLDLCRRIGATTDDERVAGIVRFVHEQRGAYGLWDYAPKPQASRWVTFDLLRSLSRLDAEGDWLSAEPRTPFAGYPSIDRRYWMGTRTRFAVHYFTLFGLMATVGPYFALVLKAQGFDESDTGLLLGFRSATALFGPLLVGYLADRFGKRRSLMTACVLVFALLMIPLAHTNSFLLAAGVAMAMGMVGRTSVPLTDALAAAELPDPARDYGPVRVWGSISFTLVLIVIGLFGLIDESSSVSILRCILIAAGFCVVSAQFLPDRHRSEHHAESLGKGEGGFDARFWVFVVAAGCHQIGMIAHYSFFPLYLKNVLHLEQSAWVWAIAAGAEIPLMFLSGRVLRRFGVINVIMAGLAAVSLRLVVYALFPTLWAVLPIQCIHGLSFALYHAACIEFVRRNAPPARRGLAMTLYMSLGAGLPALVGSSVGGFVIEAHGYRVLYGIYAVGPLLGVLMLLPLRRWMERPAEPVE